MPPPSTLPVMGSSPPTSEMLIVPVRSELDCCQLSLKVPELLPLYCPDHAPDRAPAGGTAVVEDWPPVVVVTAALGAVAAALLVVAEDDVVVLLLLAQPTVIAAAADTSTTPIALGDMFKPPRSLLQIPQRRR